ncbi:MAG: AsmA-like C-terminal region-containing protein [Burkholderiaceae bacterium]
MRWWSVPLAIAGVVAAMLLGLAIALAVGFDWRDPAWRGLLERELARTAGRPVALAGPVRLRVSGEPVLALEDVRIGAPADASNEAAGGGGDEERGEDIANTELRIARLELRVGLLASLAARWPHIEHFVAEGIEWAGAVVEDGEPVAILVEHAEGSAHAAGPTELQASGRIAGQPWRAELRGGALAALADADADWPLEVFIEAIGASVGIGGALEATGAQEGRVLAGEFDFGIGAADPQASARLLEAELPGLGPGALAGHLRLAPGRVELRKLQGSVGASRFGGELDIVPGADRPRIEGRIGAAVLDMRPFLGQRIEAQADAGPDAGSSRTLVEWYRGLDDASLPLGGMRLADARIALAVDRWIGMPADVGAASAEIVLADGRLDAPLRAHIAGVDLAGELHANADAEGGIHADLALGTADTPLGGLARWLFGIEDLRGALGGFSMRLVARGASMREIVDTTELRLVVARGGLSYGHAPGQRPVAFELGSLAMSGGAGEPLAIEANGSLLDEPVAFSLLTDPPHRIVRSGASSLSLRASSRSLELVLDGRVAADAVGAARDAAHLTLQLDAGDARDLARWLGVEIAEAMPLALAARLRGTRQRWRIEPLEASLGVHRIAGTVSYRAQDETPGLAISLEAPQVDIDELSGLLARASEDAGELSLDIPILPARLELADVDLDLRIGEIRRSALAIRDLRLAASIREGYMSASPLSLVALGVPLAGALEIDLRSDVPAMNWWLAGSDVDAGGLLRRLGFGERVDAAFASLSMHLAARGSRLGDLLDASAMTTEIVGGRVDLLDPGSGGVAGFELTTGSLVAAPGEPLRAAASGRAGPDPVAIALQAASLRELVDVERRIPLTVEAALGGARIALAGDLERPLGAGLRMAIDIAGERIDGWSAPSGIDLPGWGPYALAGDLVIDGSGYRVEDARISVGSSSVRGAARLDTSGSPPRLELRFDAPVLDLDDFTDAGWSPFADEEARAPTGAAETADPSGAGATLAEVGEQAARASDELQRLLDPATLARLDADVDIDIESLRAGDVRFGDALLRLSVAGGRARLDPVEAAVGEGRIRLVLDYAPLASGAVDTSIDLSLDRVDYSLIAHRIDPDADVAGEIDARLEIRALTPTLSQAMRYGNGTLSFQLRPRSMRADVFDLWAGNLFIALVTQFDAQDGSTVNCAHGEFELADGVLHAQRMLIDTTRVRVLGKGEVDFNDASLALRFDPWPKRAAFFSLATPIEVAGGFDDYTIGPRPGDVLMTGLRLLSSVVWVPVMKLAGASSPADGSDVCEASSGGGAPDDAAAQSAAGGAASGPPPSWFPFNPSVDGIDPYGGP